MMNEEQVSIMLANPFYAITIHPANFGEHEPLITEEKWIKAQKVMIKEIGLDVWFLKLLEALKNPITH